MPRKKAREYAMQLIYSEEAQKGGADAILEIFCSQNKIDEADREYISRALLGVAEHKAELDAVIMPKLKDWTIDRISKVSLAIIRLAIFEMRNISDVNENVAASEAARLAARYEGDEAVAFVNGILGEIIRNG